MNAATQTLKQTIVKLVEGRDRDNALSVSEIMKETGKTNPSVIQAAHALSQLDLVCYEVMHGKGYLYDKNTAAETVLKNEITISEIPPAISSTVAKAIKQLNSSKALLSFALFDDGRLEVFENGKSAYVIPKKDIGRLALLLGVSNQGAEQ